MAASKVICVLLLLSALLGAYSQPDGEALTGKLFKYFQFSNTLGDFLNEKMARFPVHKFINLEHDAGDYQPHYMVHVTVSKTSPSFQEPILCLGKEDYVKYSECWEDFHNNPADVNSLLYRASGWIEIVTNLSDHSVMAKCSTTPFHNCQLKTMQIKLSAHIHLLFHVHFSFGYCDAKAKKTRVEMYQKSLVLTERGIQSDVKFDPESTQAEVSFYMPSSRLKNLLEHISFAIRHSLERHLTSVYSPDFVSKFICSFFLE